MRNGGRRVELFAPYTSSGKTITAIEIAPIKLDHVIRWDERQFKSQFALLAELCGMPEMTLRQMTYPDVDRVLTAFWAMLPPAILNNLTSVSASPLGPSDAELTGTEEVPPPGSVPFASPPNNVVDLDDTPRTGFASAG